MQLCSPDQPLPFSALIPIAKEHGYHQNLAMDWLSAGHSYIKDFHSQVILPPNILGPSSDKVLHLLGDLN